MSKIKVNCNLDTCYVFHMLSVSKCGYDNEYGEYYKKFHNPQDLQILKNHEKLLTVNGGEYCGKLYYHLVCMPSRAEQPSDEYYKKILADTEFRRIYGDSLREIEEIAGVMIRNYHKFKPLFNEFLKDKLEATASNINEIFDGDAFSNSAVKLIGENLKTDFSALLVGSVQGGADAIDVAHNKVVFGAERSVAQLYKFIAHEYIIYLLKQTLEDTPAFQDFKYWEKVESLAEFYMTLLVSNYDSEIFLERLKDKIDFYKATYEKNNLLSAKDLFLYAVNFSNNGKS